MPRVVVLGGGVGGTCVANRLARSGRKMEILVVDSHGDHLYQPRLVRVPLYGERVKGFEDERKLLHPGVRLLVERVREIDADRRSVLLESGLRLPYDGLVLATGSRLDHSGIPGSKEASRNFHCPRSALKLQEALRGFQGGRILVGAASLPYKFPASPVEFILLLEEWLRGRGLREKSVLELFSPTSTLLPDGVGDGRLAALLKERGISCRIGIRPSSVDPSRKMLHSPAGDIPFDLLIMVPPHVTQPFVRASGLTDPEGWVRANPMTLQVRERLYAVGDTVALPCSKTGSAARLQAHAAADNLLSDLRGQDPVATYDGQAVGFAETGRGRALHLCSTYAGPTEPGPPTRTAYWKKALFGKLYFKLIRRA